MMVIRPFKLGGLFHPVFVALENLLLPGSCGGCCLCFPAMLLFQLPPVMLNFIWGDELIRMNAHTSIGSSIPEFLLGTGIPGRIPGSAAFLPGAFGVLFLGRSFFCFL